MPATVTIADSLASTSVDSRSTATATNTNAASGGSGKLTTINIAKIICSVVGSVCAIIGVVIGILKYRKKRKTREGGRSLGPLVANGTGSDRRQNNYHLHFNDRVHVNFHNSELYLTGGKGGMGSNLRIAGLGGETPRIAGAANSSSSRLLKR